MNNIEKAKLEFEKCRKDPVYFISKYVKVVHPMRGLVPFELYPFQKTIIKAIESNRFNILRKFRQAGCTTIAAAYSLWFAVFNKHKTVVILSKGDIEAVEVLERVKLMHEELPKFLRPKILSDNKHELKLHTQSTIKARAAGKQSGRGLAGSLLILDEAAFIENIDTLWTAVYPIISTGGRVFALSTVNGVGNWFHTKWIGAQEGSNGFIPIDINWEDHPEYKRTPGYDHIYKMMEKNDPPIDIDQWEKITRDNISNREWLQEYCCEFLGTGDTYVDGQILKEVDQNTSEDYYIKYNNRMRVWKDPVPNREYVIAVDVSLGRGQDNSAFHIFDAYSREQVAEFYSNKTPINEFAKVINQEGILYNTAHIIIERNTIGNGLIDRLFNDLEYENLFVDEKQNLGFQTTVNNKKDLLADMEEAIRTNLVKINSSRTVKELFTFIMKPGDKAEADKGCYDDLVMSLALSVHAINEIAGKVLPGMDWKSNEPEKPMDPFSTYTKKIQVAGGEIAEEDFRWLIS